MKKETMLTFGLVTVGTIAGIACFKSYNTDKQLKELLSNMDKLSDGINVPISEKIINKAVADAADKAATLAVDKAVQDVKDDIANTVADFIVDEVGEVAPIIQENLEKQLTLVDISDIKKDVVVKAAKMVAENITLPSFISTGYSSGSTSDIIKNCTEAGMSSWEIRQILESLPK